jgi:hypothetical protein
VISYVLSGLAALVPQSTGEAVRELLAVDEFRSAWALACREDDDTTRARAKTEILYRAGDPAGAWSEAQAGLASNPVDPELLFYAASAALWLGDGELAQRTADRLRRVVADLELSPPDRAAWEASIEGQLRRAREALAQEASRSRALSRARALAVLSLAGGAVLAAWSARGKGPDRH